MALVRMSSSVIWSIVVHTSVMSGIWAGWMCVFWSSHSEASASASGREGTARLVPRGVRSGMPSRVTPNHLWLSSFVGCELEGERARRSMVWVGRSMDTPDAELVPSTPGEMGLVFTTSVCCGGGESAVVSLVDR